MGREGGRGEGVSCEKGSGRGVRKGVGEGQKGSGRGVRKGVGEE